MDDQRGRPAKSFAAVATAARAPFDASKPTSAGPAPSGPPGGTTSTGHGAWWISELDVEPRYARASPPWPREPATITSGDRSAATSRIPRHALADSCTAALASSPAARASSAPRSATASASSRAARS